MTRNRFFRLLAVLLGLGIWYGSQFLLGDRIYNPGGVTGSEILTYNDGLLELFKPVNTFLNNCPSCANALLIVSSGIIDILGITILLQTIFGTSFRPFIGLLILFSLRQIVQFLCELPPPLGMVFHYPGFPSLLVTYSVTNGFFFSGHTAMAVFGATQIIRLNCRGMIPLAVLIVLFEMITLLVLRAHYTMDIFTGAVTALWVAQIIESRRPKFLK